MLLESLGALCEAPDGAGRVWMYLDALVRATRVSGRIEYRFQTDLHFADIVFHSRLKVPDGAADGPVLLQCAAPSHPLQ